MIPTKTIKLQKNEYTNFTEEFEQHDILLMNGARGSGKSYPVAKHISNLLLKDEDAKFFYMRIKDEELSTCITWCKDLELEQLSGTYKNIITRGSPSKGDIKLQGLDENDKVIYERIIGKAISLQSSYVFKSGKYDDYIAVVFEEYTHKRMNADAERDYVFNFMENIESIFRDRKKRIYCMGNSLKTLPLLEQWIDELTGVKFENPLKIKIFRNNPEHKEKNNSYLLYLNGESYVDDAVIYRAEDFFDIFSNKDYIIRKSYLYPKLYYVMANKNKYRIPQDRSTTFAIKNLCVNAANNEILYQNQGIERKFAADYRNIIAELENFATSTGRKYLA